MSQTDWTPTPPSRHEEFASIEDAAVRLQLEVPELRRRLTAQQVIHVAGFEVELLATQLVALRRSRGR